MLFRTRKRPVESSALAVADDLLADVRDQLPSAVELRERTAALAARIRQGRSTADELEIRRLRNLSGMALLAESGEEKGFPEPARELPPLGGQSRIHEIGPGQLTPELLRGAILSTGALLIRGLVDAERATRMADGIERSLQVREQVRSGGEDREGWYHEMKPAPPFRIAERPWIERGGGLLAVDSPRLLFEMIEMFTDAGLDSVIDGYLGEPGAISGQKCTLRKASPGVPGGWHQDGSFLANVRSLNVWVSLSRCGEDAPSMDVVPKRLDHIVKAGGPGTDISIQVTPEDADEAAGSTGIVRPVFDPGDALLFDHMFLHATGSDPSMPNPRYAIESWFFAASAYPEHYVPIAL